MRILLLCLALAIPMTIPFGLCAAETTVPADRMVALIGALSDHRRSVHEPAINGLIAIGPDVLPDLNVLAKDPSAQVRGRVALVASGIGGEHAFPLLIRLSQDRDNHVREVAVLGLGGTRHPNAYERLVPFLRDPIPGVRESAGLALGGLEDLRAIGDLTMWPEAGGARANLQLRLPPEGEQQLKRIQKAMQTSLKHLVMRPSALDEVIAHLNDLPAYRQVTLLETTWELSDVRLSEVLAQLLKSEDAHVRRAAATSLAANGDGRALQALCSAAAADPSPSVRDAAAETLRRLTGHQAGPGPAWQLWWRQHGMAVSALADRDRFVASLYDPKREVTREELSAFTPLQLMPLIDGTLGSGGPWWPGFAWRALSGDDPARWTPVLFDRYERNRGEEDRIGMVVLLDQLGDPAARPKLKELLDAVRLRRKGLGYHGEGSLELALALIVEGAERRPLRAHR